MYTFIGHMRRQVCCVEGGDSVLGSLILTLLYSNHRSSTVGDKEHPCLSCSPIKFLAACHCRSLVFFCTLRRELSMVIGTSPLGWFLVKQTGSSQFAVVGNSHLSLFSCLARNRSTCRGEILHNFMIYFFFVIFMQQDSWHFDESQRGVVWKSKMGVPHPLRKMSLLD